MPISPRASEIGLPALRASSVARSSGPLLERVGQPVQQARAVRRRHGAPGRGRPPWRGRPRRRSPRPPPARARPAPPRWRARYRLWGSSSVAPPPHARPRPVRRPRPSSTSSSGCQSTPSAKRLVRQSRSPRPARRAPTSRSRRGPRPARRSPDDGASGRSAAPRRRPERQASRARAAPRGRRTRRACDGAGRACSRCCSSVPPQATFSSSMPRQMPSSGSSRSRARWASASSKRSRSGRVCADLRVRPGAVARWVDVGARRRAAARRGVPAARRATRPRRRPAAGSERALRLAGRRACRYAAACRPRRSTRPS